MIGCLRTRVRKQPIIAFSFESENELKFDNLEALFDTINKEGSFLFYISRGGRFKAIPKGIYLDSSEKTEVTLCMVIDSSMFDTINKEGSFLFYMSRGGRPVVC